MEVYKYALMASLIYIFRCMKDYTRRNNCSLSKMDVVNSSVGIFQSKEVSGEKWILTRLIQVSDRHKYGRIVGDIRVIEN